MWSPPRKPRKAAVQTADMPAQQGHTQFARRLFAEALGTALLLAVVIGSGVMAERAVNDQADERAGELRDDESDDAARCDARKAVAEHAAERGGRIRE